MTRPTLIDAIIPDRVRDVLSFWQDPFGSMYESGRDALVDLSGKLISRVVELTLPNLELPAFLQTYAVSFALSMFVAVLLLIAQLVRMARSGQSVRDTLESIAVYFPLFILSMMFGPAIGIILVDFTHALSLSVIDFAYAGSIDDMFDMYEQVFVDDPTLILGGAAVAWMIVWAQVIGTLVLALFFIAQLVVLYFSGVLIPLTVVQMVSPARRQGATVAVTLWVGILLVHPLLFLLQGFAFRLMLASVGEWGEDGWQNLINILVALCAQWLAILSPFFLVPYIKKMADGTGNPSGMGGAAAAIGAGTLAGAAVRGAGSRATRAPSGRQPIRTHAIPARGDSPAATPGIGSRSLSSAARTAARRERAGGMAAATRGGAAAGGAATRAGAAGAARVHPAAAAAVTAAQAGAGAVRKSDENANVSAVNPTPQVGKDRPV